MPFKSQAQRKWMYANKPKMAKKWEKHTPKGKKLPKKVKKKKKKKKTRRESFERLLDQALGLLGEEQSRNEPTTRPVLGSKKGATKSSINPKPVDKKKTKPTK